ncbi:MAG: ATP-binding protein [Deltaproteobacteria bacterium]|nr:ATP-binding protein [Deltaproteobacteria bacterium]
MTLEPFEIHNLFWHSLDEYLKLDPHLNKLASIPLVHKPELLNTLPINTPGIYIVTGGRQVGKSTLFKLMIQKILGEKDIKPKQIFYLPCDTLETFSQLLSTIESFEESLDQNEYFYLFIDEVTYVREWDRAIKSLADKGFFNNGCAIISGSDSFLLREAMMGFPGRRGMAPQTDFHLYPLSYFEYTALHKKSWIDDFHPLREEFKNTLAIPFGLNKHLPHLGELYSLWSTYLQTGGYLTALNSLHTHQTILPAVYRTYVQWVVGDMLKREKKEIYVHDIFQALIHRPASQITWNSLLSDVRIEHHQTIADYVYHLERMGVLLECPAFREDKFRAAPKKARKIHFQDPFIFHAMHGWIRDEKNPFELTQKTLSPENDWLAALVEGCIASLAARTFQTYYIKGEGEVDLALVSHQSFLPIEVKWSLTPKPAELKQLLKYKNGVVAYRGENIGFVSGAKVLPIPLLALLLG